MRLTTLDRELARLAPTPGPDALDATRKRVMAAITDATDAAAATSTPTDTAPPLTGAPTVLPLPRRTTRSRRVAVRLGIAASLAAAKRRGRHPLARPVGLLGPRRLRRVARGP